MPHSPGDVLTSGKPNVILSLQVNQMPHSAILHAMYIAIAAPNSGRVKNKSENKTFCREMQYL